MTDELVCVATFDTAAEAHLCRGQLEAAGIPAKLENEHTVTAYWLWSNALGGIRLYVAPENRDAALRVLAQGRHIFHFNEASGESLNLDGEVTAESEPQPPAKRWNKLDDEDDEDDPQQIEREEHARRALSFAIAGMVISPLQIFTLWIVWEVATMPGKIRPLYRFYCTAAGLIAVAYLLVLVTIVTLMVIGFP